jgi:hypothetical protein
MAKKPTEPAPTTEPQPGSANALILLEEKALERSQYSSEKLLKGKRSPFAVDLAGLARVDRCVELQNTRGSQTAELACHLFALREGDWVQAAAPVGDLPAAESFNDVVDTRFNMSPAKANQLAAQWSNFLALGLHPSVLRHVVWDRLCELGPGIRAGVITEDNIAEWLPLCEPLGQPYALRALDLQRAVKNFVAQEVPSDDEDEDGENMRTIRLTMSQNHLDIYLSFQELLKRAASQSDNANAWPTDIEILVEAMSAQASMMAENGDRLWRAIGLQRLKDTVERVVPGVSAVYVAPPDDPNYVLDHIGVRAVHSVYQGFAKSANGEDQLLYVLATSAEEAAATMGIDPDTVREHQLIVSNELKTSVTKRLPSEEATLPVSAPLEEVDEEEEAEDEELEPEEDAELEEEPAEDEDEEEEEVDAVGNERPVYAKLTKAKRKQLLTILGKTCREEGLATTSDYSAVKARAQAEHEHVEDPEERGLLSYTMVTDWLFDLLDEAEVYVELPKL